MGGNAFPQTERIDLQTYNSIGSDLIYSLNAYLMMQRKFKEEPSEDPNKHSYWQPEQHPYYFGIVRHYGEKQDFGDMDLIGTVPKETILEFFKLNKVFNVLGVKNHPNELNFCVRDSKTGKTVQIDYIYTDEAYFEFAYNYYAFNDLSALIGKVASFLDLNFGHDGLSKTIYFDTDANVLDVPKLKLNRDEQQQQNMNKVFDKKKLCLTQDYAQALSMLDLPSHIYESKEDLKKHITTFCHAYEEVLLDNEKDTGGLTPYSQKGMGIIYSREDLFRFPMQSEYFSLAEFATRINHKTDRRDRIRKNIVDATQFYMHVDRLVDKPEVSMEEVIAAENAAMRLRYQKRAEHRLVLTPFEDYTAKLKRLKDEVVKKRLAEREFSIPSILQHLSPLHPSFAEYRDNIRKMKREELNKIKDFKTYLVRHAEMPRNAHQLAQMIQLSYDEWLRDQSNSNQKSELTL